MKPLFTLPDGGKVPRRYHLLRAAAMRGRIARRLALSGRSGQLVLERLPALRATYPDGRVFLLSAGDRTYARVFFFGEHEPATSAVLHRLIRPGDFAIDIGANSGWFSLLMASLTGQSGEVWAIEPLPTVLPLLRANLEANPDLEIRVLDLAVGADPGRVTINRFAGLTHVHASLSTLGRSDYAGHDVEGASLDQLLSAHDGDAPDVIKVDVEGAELDVLHGARSLLDSDQTPIWILEVNYSTAAAFGYRPEALVARLRSHGPHDVYRIARGGRLEREVAPAHAPHGANWLCVPAERRDRLASESWGRAR